MNDLLTWVMLFWRFWLLALTDKGFRRRLKSFCTASTSLVQNKKVEDDLGAGRFCAEFYSIEALPGARTCRILGTPQLKARRL